jgi:hypothetical protein
MPHTVQHAFPFHGIASSCKTLLRKATHCPSSCWGTFPLPAGVLVLTARYYVWRARVLGIACCAIVGIFVGHNLLVIAFLLASRCR